MPHPPRIPRSLERSAAGIRAAELAVSSVAVRVNLDYDVRVQRIQDMGVRATAERTICGLQASAAALRPGLHLADRSLDSDRIACESQQMTETMPVRRA